MNQGRSSFWALHDPTQNLIYVIGGSSSEKKKGRYADVSNNSTKF